MPYTNKKWLSKHLCFKGPSLCQAAEHLTYFEIPSAVHVPHVCDRKTKRHSLHFPL